MIMTMMMMKPCQHKDQQHTAKTAVLNHCHGDDYAVAVVVFVAAVAVIVVLGVFGDSGGRCLVVTDVIV